MIFSNKASSCDIRFLEYSDSDVVDYSNIYKSFISRLASSFKNDNASLQFIKKKWKDGGAVSNLELRIDLSFFTTPRIRLVHAPPLDFLQ